MATTSAQIAGTSGASNMKTRELFIEALLQKERSKESHLNILTKEHYAALLQQVKDAKTSTKKTALQYRRLQRFDVYEVGNVQKLISKDSSEEKRYYLPIEEIYDVIEGAHFVTGHGGRDRIKRETSRNYANITGEMIGIFISMCDVCNAKRKKQTVDPKLTLHSQLNSRGQVDFLDMQSQADGNYKFILVYQDHATKFVLLRPLWSEKPQEVAHHLVDIFTTIGAPCMLHSNNGREFVSAVIGETTRLWPELKLVHGKSQHHQSQGSTGRAKQEVKNMLGSWMRDQKTNRWSDGLRFIQFMKNRAWHSGINSSPYQAMFGVSPKTGLSTTGLPFDVINKIQSEEDLEKLLRTVNFETGNSGNGGRADDVTGPKSEIKGPIVETGMSQQQEQQQQVTPDQHVQHQANAATTDSSPYGHAFEFVSHAPGNMVFSVYGKDMTGTQ